MRVETVNSASEFMGRVCDHSSNQSRVQIVLESGCKDVTPDELNKEVNKQLLAWVVSGRATIRLRIVAHGEGYAQEYEIRFWKP